MSRSLALLVLATSAWAQTPAEQTYVFDLPAQPLADALPKVASTTGREIIFDANAVAGKQAPALQGSYTTTQALDTVLAGTSLESQTGSGSSIAVRPANATVPVTDVKPAATTSGGNAVMLEPMLVTTEGSQRVLVVTRADLDLRQANDLKDTLSMDPTVSVGGSTAIAQKIYVRNLGEGLINVSVDGATQSGGLFHHVGRTTLEPELLQQVEVQPGIGSATDGPGALGGAIRFVTKDPGDLLEPGERAGALVKQGYFSNTDGLKSSVTGFGRANDTWSGLLSVVYSDHDNITDGNGDELLGSDSQQQVIFGKVVGQFKNGHTVRFGYENLQEEGDKLRRPEWAAGPTNVPFYMEAERDTGTFGYGFRPDEIEWIDLAFTTSFTDAVLFQDGPFGPYYGGITGLQFDLRNTHRIAEHSIVYGVDLRRDDVTAGPAGDRDQFSEKGSVAGIFTQGELKATDRLTLNAGARYDSYRLEDSADQKYRDNGFSPNVGATFDVTREFALSAGVSTAFRGPGINDAFRIDSATNDPDMDAESAINYELRATYKRGGLILEAGGYISRIDDLIVYDMTGLAPFDYSNAGLLKTEGAFARVSYTMGNVTGGLQFNHADTSLDGQDATRYQYGSLASSIGDTWVADLVWRPVDQLDLGWNMRLVQGLDDIAIDDDVTGVAGATINKPGYTTHDVFLRWRPTFAKALTLTLTVKNIFDKQYLSHGSVEDFTAIPGFGAVRGAPDAGRDIRITASLRF
ncbi:MAG: TonB-dependent receptor [Rariglobus sp.]